MKNFYLIFRMKFFMLISGLIFSSLILNANTLKINKEGKTDLKVKVNTYEKLSVINTLSDINYFDINTSKGIFTEFSISKYSNTSEIGSPKLPVMRKLIEIPFGAQIKINILSYKVKEYQLKNFGISNKIIPTQPPIPKSGQTPDFVYNENFYKQNTYYPNKLADVDILGIMRGTRMGRLNISPVQYNPVTNTIKVYSEIEVEICFENADIAKTLKNKEKNNSPYFNTVFSQLLNYKKSSNTKDTLSKYPIKYVIISDPMFHNALQPFINWKKKKGFNVVEAYTDDPNVGNSTSSIKSYLQGLYESGTVYDPSPTFVLFVGDIGQVPAFNGTQGSHVTDLYYCEYSNDYLPEVYYGRFSARNLDELQPQIDKTLEYEQFLFPDPTYLNEVVMIAGVDASHAPTYGNGQINYGTTYYFNEAHGLLSHTYLYPESGNSASQIHQNVSDGVSYANYTAHGSPNGWANPSFTVSDIAALQNEHKYPLMVGNCCLTSKFNEPNCFAEALLRADKKGALGYIGASNSSYWDEDFYWGVGVGSITANPTYEGTTLGAYDRTFHDHSEPYSDWYVTQDEMVFAGNLAVTEGSSMYKYYWEIYCLMGDPSLMVYFSAPPDLTANYNIIPLGVSTVTVNTEPYAYVAISKDNTLYGAALANNNGVAQVKITPFTQPCNANLVITKQNFKPLITTILVSGAPGQATNCNPMDGQNKVSPYTSLNWQDGIGGTATSYTLYFGTDNPPSNIANGITLTDTFYIPASSLDYYTQYF
ncbi:MAG: hypothetical protein J7J86_07405, partial [Bacteroidales bacterium]|nr:hypothetical protein [Bacteroidales bacterium]